MQTTITEALAELKTLGKRIEKKRESVAMFLTRQDGLKDPLEKDGGSVEFIKRERQAVKDLEQHHVNIRLAIQRACTPLESFRRNRLLLRIRRQRTRLHHG